jgi:aspartate/methionine/tyrosine aminotransferase
MQIMKEPWSKKHKKDFMGRQYSLSNSFAQPLSHPELVELTKARNDQSLLNDYVNHSLEYTPNGGSDDLKHAISMLYGPNINAANILVFPGGQVAIQVAAQAFARNCHSIVFTPGYQSTVESPEWAMNSTGVTQIKRKASQRWQIDIDEVKKSIRDDTKYMVINEPHNPGGIVMDITKQKELIELCQKHNIIILSDEVYRLLEHDADTDRIPAIAEAYSQGGVSCVTMSKPWGACGISVGWLACSNLDMISKLWDCQYFGTACISRSSEIQAIMVLRASDTILQDRLCIIRKNKALLQDVIENKYPDLFEWERPNAGAVGFVKFMGPLTSLELGSLLGDRGISIKPAYCFSGDNVTPEIDYFRVGFGERKMPLALDAFVSVIEEFKDEWRKQKLIMK